MAWELLVAAGGIWFPDQGLNPGPLHGSTESQPLEPGEVLDGISIVLFVWPTCLLRAPPSPLSVLNGPLHCEGVSPPHYRQITGEWSSLNQSLYIAL